MMVRLAMVVVAVLAASPARAQSMSADAARRFVTGKLFAFNCFDGSRGAGRIYGDGSVIASLQLQGSGPVRALWLPAGTLRIKGGAYCASLRGLAFEPCFNLMRIDDRSFRGSVSGLGFAYCDFTRRMAVASMSPRLRAHEPLPLAAAPVAADGAE